MTWSLRVEIRELDPTELDELKDGLKLRFGDRVRTTTTIQWLRDEELKPPPPVSRPRTPYLPHR